MLRRLTTLTVIAALLGGYQPASAQDPNWPAGPDRFTPWAGQGMWPPNGGYPPYSLPAGSQLLEPYRPAPGRVETPQGMMRLDQAQSGGYASDCPPGYGPGPAACAKDPLSTWQYVPSGDDRGPFYHDSPFHKGTKAVLQETWLRLDYLNWSLTGPGEALVGAEYRNFDPRTDFLLATERDGALRFDIGSGLPFQAQAHDLSAMDLDHRNGLRATLGLPTENGGIEASIWTLQQADESFSIAPTTSPSGLTLIPVITLLVDGQKPDPNAGDITPMILFDDGYSVTLQTELMGAEANYVGAPWQEGIPVQLRPLLGFRYVRMHETLTVAGSDLFTALNPQIVSESLNNVFGPSLGMRLEWTHKKLMIGAESKFTLGFNRHEDRVRTSEIFRDTINGTVVPARQTAEGHTDFAPIYQLQVYAQAQVSHRLSLRVGYDFMTMFEISRPYNNVYWNDTGVIDDPSQVIVRARDRETFIGQGLFVSGELSIY
jgi:hypothetical protein